MSSNRLRLNPAKTKFIWLWTRQQLAQHNLADLATEFHSYTFSSTVRDLGILLDQKLTFAPHLHHLSRACFYQLHQLRAVVRSLTTSAATTLVHSFITVRLDYCLSLYSGLPYIAGLFVFTVSCAQQRALLVEYLNLITSLTTCWSSCTGFRSTSVSNIGSAPWCGDASWASPQLTYLTYVGLCIPSPILPHCNYSESTLSWLFQRSGTGSPGADPLLLPVTLSEILSFH
jgi:hypothetical protein